MRPAIVVGVAGVAMLGIAVTSAWAIKYEARSVSVTKTSGSGPTVLLNGKVTSKSAGCHVGVRVRLDRLRANGTWATIRSSRTKTKGRFAWSIAGIKAKARVVVPQVTKPGLVCAPVTLGFDRGYLSP
jgi:hypothetical protein